MHSDVCLFMVSLSVIISALHLPVSVLRNFTWTLSPLSAHVVNRLLRENRKSIPNFLMVKQTFFKNVTLQMLNFILTS